MNIFTTVAVSLLCLWLCSTHIVCAHPPTTSTAKTADINTYVCNTNWDLNGRDVFPVVVECDLKADSPLNGQLIQYVNDVDWNEGNFDFAVRKLNGDDIANNSLYLCFEVKNREGREMRYLQPSGISKNVKTKLLLGENFLKTSMLLSSLSDSGSVTLRCYLVVKGRLIGESTPLTVPISNFPISKDLK